MATAAMTLPEGPARSSSSIRATSADLAVGSILAERYEILKVLGQGGMGAVYKAKDIEVDRTVAVKVIRPELANEATILARFKRELILSRQVTHKNVVRIYDIGEADGIKFITMEFVEGQDLRAVLDGSTSLSLAEKVRIAVQICRALESAHSEGVVHRDLKPQNILVENSGRVVVMDFGIAHSMQDSGMTSAGALLGTPAYVSPEQAKGEKIDARSDIYTFGIVFYELLTGKIPFESDTLVGLLLKRIQERPVPPMERDKDIPQGLSDVVLKCLAVEKEARYQSAVEVEKDLEAWLDAPTTFRTIVDSPAVQSPLPKGSTRSIVTPRMMMMSQSNAWKWIAASVVIAAVLAGIAFAVITLRSKPAGPHAPVTVVIADIANHTGDPIFDSTLEPILKIALEGSPFISAYDRSQMRALGVQPVPARLDEPAAQQVAVGQGLNVVVSGSLDRAGSGYALSLKATQAVTGNNIVIAEDNAPNKDQVLATVTQVASKVRKALGDDTSEAAQRFAMETLSASSLEAVREYSGAMNFLSNGKYEDARQSFSKSTDLDPNFGLAYAGAAIASVSLNEQQDAEKFARSAIQHIDRMTERERYRTRGMFYVVTGNQQKCVEEYSALVTKYASDVAAHNNLGACYSHLRNMPKAIEEMSKAAEILPKRALYQFNLALYNVYAGDFAGAEKIVRAAQKLNPAYGKGYLTLAYAQIGQGKLSDAAATYGQLQALNASGASLAESGLADIAIYKGSYSEAAQILEKAATADLAAKRTQPAADKFGALAYTELLRGRKGPAMAAAERALANNSTPKTQFLAARVFAAGGQPMKAQSLADKLSADLLAEPQAYGKLIEGQIALQAGNSRQAIQSFTDANRLADLWIGHFDLASAYLKAGAFTEADSEFEQCIKRRGEAMELFMDDIATYGFFPTVYYYQAQVREGMKTPGFADSYRTYLTIRGEAGEDPLLAEVRRRAGQ
jgi:serine/threonine protein kinase/tetratricopeptide (TPR) repeat protein